MGLIDLDVSRGNELFPVLFCSVPGKNAEPILKRRKRAAL